MPANLDFALLAVNRSWASWYNVWSVSKADALLEAFLRIVHFRLAILHPRLKTILPALTVSQLTSPHVVNCQDVAYRNEVTLVDIEDFLPPMPGSGLSAACGSSESLSRSRSLPLSLSLNLFFNSFLNFFMSDYSSLKFWDLYIYLGR
jgi:hypothetical protein